MTWSRGLRSALRLVVVDDTQAAAETADGAETDESLASSARGDQVVAVFDTPTWRRIWATDELWRLLERAEGGTAIRAFPLTPLCQLGGEERP